MLGIIQFLYDLFSLSKGPKVIQDAWSNDPRKPKDVIIGRLEPEVSNRDSSPNNTKRRTDGVRPLDATETNASNARAEPK